MRRLVHSSWMRWRCGLLLLLLSLMMMPILRWHSNNTASIWPGGWSRRQSATFCFNRTCRGRPRRNRTWCSCSRWNWCRWSGGRCLRRRYALGWRLHRRQTWACGLGRTRAGCLISVGSHFGCCLLVPTVLVRECVFSAAAWSAVGVLTGMIYLAIWAEPLVGLAPIFALLRHSDLLCSVP